MTAVMETDWVRTTSTFKANDGHEYELTTAQAGEGAQGTVFRGRQLATDTTVAIKRVPDGAARGPEKNRELEIALQLGEAPRQYLLAPLTWAVDGTDLLLVMPWAKPSLADALKQHPGGLGEDEAKTILRDVTTGLVELRAAGIVHRDLKPSNILFADGRWHLADFGMSRDLDASTATHTFTYGGTPLYLAPERWQGMPATYKTDLYALGCIGFELVSGHSAFGGPDHAGLQRQHLYDQPPSVPASDALARWIMRLLSKDPNRRHQDAQDALAALPAATTVAGPLAEAARARTQQQQQQEAAQASVTAAADERLIRRQQALADLEDTCAAAADRARQQLPDLTFTSNTTVFRFAVVDIELAFIVFWPPFGDHHGAVLAGEVSSATDGRRRCAANVVCEEDAMSRLHWYFETFTRNPMAGVVGEPAGFEHDTTYFEHYGHLLQGGLYEWDRARQSLTADLIVDVLGRLLQDGL